VVYQRQLAFLPGIGITDARSLRSVENSTRDRFLLYDYSWNKLITEKYYFIGRGVAMRASDSEEGEFGRAIAGGMWSHPRFNYAKHNYHSMFLQILIDNGLLGALLFLGFLILFLWKRARYLLQSEPSMWRDISLVFCVTMAVHNIVYLTFTVSYSEYITYNILFILLIELSLQQLEQKKLGVRAKEVAAGDSDPQFKNRSFAVSE
jgi:hypothetical protein